MAITPPHTLSISLETVAKKKVIQRHDGKFSACLKAPHVGYTDENVCLAFHHFDSRVDSASFTSPSSGGGNRGISQCADLTRDINTADK